MARYEIRIAGYGGQGVITLSKMITMACAIHENLATTQTEAYSAAARGGSCWAEVVVDLDKEVKIIDYPKALEPYDILIILSQESANRIRSNVLKKEKNTGYLIWDTSTIQEFKAANEIPNAFRMPIQKISLETFGNTVYGNSIIFGIFSVLSGIFSEKSATKTIKEFVPSYTLDTNMKAFEIGRKAGQDFLNKLHA